MSTLNFQNRLLNHFALAPTPGQTELIQKLSDFIFSTEKIFVLKGFAGTGKTSVISALVKTLETFEITAVLMTPTGRAAKVLSNYSGKKAFTVHKTIYSVKSNKQGGVFLQLKKNYFQNAVFVIDEASMISGAENSDNKSFYSSRNLLDDLMEFTSEGENCKLIFVGDVAQLPPVGLLVSPALDAKYLKNQYFLNDIPTQSLRDVMRQEKDSGILFNATEIRKNLENKTFRIKIQLDGFDDVKKIDGREMEDAMAECYALYGKENTILITRSNKRANQYNLEIRSRLLGRDDEISAGDQLMVVKNNYHWLDEKSEAGFIANGDFIELISLRNLQEVHGFRFADASFKMLDYPDMDEVKAKVILDTLAIESPSLSFEQNNKLYQSISAEYSNIPKKEERQKKIKEDPYYNALQIKFGYAVTCHKAQGGQWPAVFVDQGYLTDEMVNTEYLRWLYTAFTRASQKLYLVNFSEKFFIS